MIDTLFEMGIVSAPDGSKPREVNMKGTRVFK